LLKKNEVDYEFRTTCVPGLIDEEAILKIGPKIEGARRWFLQQYVPTNAYKEEYRTRQVFKSPEIEKLLTAAREYVTNVKWRGQTY
jgi:pyruvate formate lyase activating enzyme